mmetsp:Transcript_36337/g.75601  ORF Transcript_36337/g.75601 Transcript_36337/m.75601 type:complete len:885 (-) Transcript_36337:1599-4253(-)
MTKYDGKSILYSPSWANTPTVNKRGRSGSVSSLPHRRQHQHDVRHQRMDATSPTSTPQQNRPVYLRPRVRHGSNERSPQLISSPSSSSLSPGSARTQQHLHSSQPQQRQTPFLTLALLKLDELTEKFLKALAHPNYQTACEACVALDTSIANTTTSSTSPGSPATHTRSPATRRGAPRSPTKSPFGWLSGAASRTNDDIQPSSASALEGEWEEFQKPFLFLAAAEVWYAELAHVKASKSSSSGRDVTGERASALSRIYNFLKTEFLKVRNKLCLPFLSDSDATQRDETVAAFSLSNTLLSLSDFCSCRAILVEAQCNFFRSVGTSDRRHVIYKDMQEIVEGELSARKNNKSTPKHDKRQAFSPLKDVWMQELEAWKQLLTAVASLEQCLFMESIISLRLLQKIVSKNSALWKCSAAAKDARTPLWTWITDSLQVFCSLLPIYFDRVRAFAGPLYNFDTTHPAVSNSSQDWDSNILQFLRQQAKIGGPPTAVAVILDAVSTNNLNLEKGFSLSSKATTNPLPASQDLTTDARTIWPAVYLRSSTMVTLDRSTSVSGASRGNSRTSFAQLTRGTSASSANASAASAMSNPTSNVLQYGSELSDTHVATSFPHTEWVSLATVLAETTIEALEDESHGETLPSVLSVRMTYEGIAATYKEDGNELVKEEIEEISASMRLRTSVEKNQNIFGALSDFFKVDHREETAFNKEYAGIEGGSARQSSSFHVVSLSSFLSLAVIVKSEDPDGSFLRRRGKLSDSDIRTFLNNTAENLRVSQIFNAACLPPYHEEDTRKTANSKSLSPALLDLPTNDFSEQVLPAMLQRVKGAFGLRPASPFQEKRRNFSILPQKKAPRELSGPHASSISVDHDASDCFCSWGIVGRNKSNLVD